MKIMNNTLPLLTKDKYSFDSQKQKQYENKVLEKIKSNIFYKVFKPKTENFGGLQGNDKSPLKAVSRGSSKDNLYERIRKKEHPINFSSVRSKEKKTIDVNHKRKR